MQIFASASIDSPSRRRLAPARAVAARHRHGAPRDGRGARPRLFALLRTGAMGAQAGGASRTAVSARRGDRLDDLLERPEAMTAHERITVLERGDHAGR